MYDDFCANPDGVMISTKTGCQSKEIKNPVSEIHKCFVEPLPHPRFKLKKK